MLMPMDTSTSSKGEAIPDFCRSKVSRRLTHNAQRIVTAAVRANAKNAREK